jgi:hypothetical protein
MQVPPHEAFALKEDDRPTQAPIQKLAKAQENLAVECPSPGKRHHDGRAIGAPSSAAGPLHVVGAARRDVAKENAVQTANVDTEFHRGGR